jgi:hypothetical protein
MQWRRHRVRSPDRQLVRIYAVTDDPLVDTRRSGYRGESHLV